MVHTSNHYILIAGTGAAARTFGRLFAQAGERIVFASRDGARAQRAADDIGENTHALTYEDVSGEISRVLIAVPDDVITAVATRLAARANCNVALHTSGNFGPEVLYPLSIHGTECGAIHPLQTLTGSARDLSALRGAGFAVSGDQEAVAWAESIAQAAGGESFKIPPEFRAFYHAAAVMASNYVTAMVDVSELLLGQAGIASETARRILHPLLRTAVENTIQYGPVAALTGPIARGDVRTVASHLNALSSLPESVQLLYRAAGLRTLDIAQRKGLACETIAGLRALLQ
ncbi:MAG TPA: Rossmann-like and DUF2520 domain-containing protein [Bryobacteraceae bacterium]|nr:Rossmann-like and DUF2520 domain-containing protein [Bryobacteraceae bacterium]